MHDLEIVLGVLQQKDERYVLQRRDLESRIGAAGMIGCLGGQAELGESEISAICREVNQVTSLETTARDWEKLGERSVMTDLYEQPVMISATAFRHNRKLKGSLELKKGEVVRWNEEEIFINKPRLTPATLAIFEDLILKGGLWG